MFQGNVTSLNIIMLLQLPWYTEHLINTIAKIPDKQVFNICGGKKTCVKWFKDCAFTLVLFLVKGEKDIIFLQWVGAVSEHFQPEENYFRGMKPGHSHLQMIRAAER